MRSPPSVPPVTSKQGHPQPLHPAPEATCPWILHASLAGAASARGGARFRTQFTHYEFCNHGILGGGSRVADVGEGAACEASGSGAPPRGREHVVAHDGELARAFGHHFVQIIFLPGSTTTRFNGENQRSCSIMFAAVERDAFCCRLSNRRLFANHHVLRRCFSDGCRTIIAEQGEGEGGRDRGGCCVCGCTGSHRQPRGRREGGLSIPDRGGGGGGGGGLDREGRASVSVWVHVRECSS